MKGTVERLIENLLSDSSDAKDYCKIMQLFKALLLFTTCDGLLGNFFWDGSFIILQFGLLILNIINFRQLKVI